MVYNDAVTGIESRFKVGELIVDMDETDLESMIFKASELELTHSDITFIQTAVSKTEDSESSTLPTLTVDELTLTKVFANYQNQTDNITAILDIEELYTEIPKVDLVNQQFEITEFSLKDSSITLKTETEKNAVTEKVEEVSEDIEQDILKFEWPDLQLDLAEIELENNNFSYLVNNETGKKGVFNSNAIVLTNINLQAEDIKLKDKIAYLQLDDASFKEVSGIHLKNLQLSLDATDKQLNISNLKPN